MSPESFAIFRGLLKLRAGLLIAPERQDVLEARLLAAARRMGFDTPEELALKLARGPDRSLEQAVIEAAVARETMFFRDREPFEQLRTILAELRERRSKNRRIRIWSAACSTGQEAYSIAMILDDEARHFRGWSLDIVATDISDLNLGTAAEGFYNQFEVQRGLPSPMLLRYFHQEGERWRIDGHLRHRVRFERFNLLEDPARLGNFDIVFCRNVLIYFDLAARRRVLDNIGGVLAGDGVLCLGSSETTLGVTRAFAPHPQHPAFLMTADEIGAPNRHLRLVG